MRTLASIFLGLWLAHAALAQSWIAAPACPGGACPLPNSPPSQSIAAPNVAANNLAVDSRAIVRIVNATGLKLRDAHFWGMDEWVEDGKPVPPEHALSFARTDKEMCFDRIDKALRMPDANLHFPTGDLAAYSHTYDRVRCVIMQGGQGDVKHWAFNDPLRRKGKYKDNPPSPAEYRKLTTRVVDLHPLTVMQNARTSGGGQVSLVPSQAATVGPVETWKAEKVSIWHGGKHDSAFGIRLTALMISKKVPDSAVPMSLLADHPNVQFNYLRSGIGSVAVEMH